MDHLHLEVTGSSGPGRWNWRLTQAGTFLADHDVRLDGLDTRAWQRSALADVPAWLAGSPGEENALLDRLGDWLSGAALGGIGDALARHCPAAVRLTVPPAPGLAGVLELPLELARVNGRPLGLSGITFAREICPAGPPPPLRAASRTPPQAAPPPGMPRILAVFSRPDGAPAAPGPSRDDLAEAVRMTQGRADLRVLEYGATAERLADALEESEGWDAVHISAPPAGDPGILLETTRGAPDPLSADGLGSLLATAGSRLALVTLSVAPPAGTRSALALPAAVAFLTGRAAAALRHPGPPGFAAAFWTGTYDRMLRARQPLSRAASLTLARFPDTPGMRAAALTAPVLFGGTGAFLPASAEQAPLLTAGLQSDGFPPRPAKTGAAMRTMAAAATALDPGSGTPGVLLNGGPDMARLAAADAAYSREASFPARVWHECDGPGGALEALADAVDAAAPGLGARAALARPGGAQDMASRLAVLMRSNRALIVLSGTSTLLTEARDWRDDRWDPVISALADPRNAGRVIVAGDLPAGSGPAVGSHQAWPTSHRSGRPVANWPDR